MYDDGHLVGYVEQEAAAYHLATTASDVDVGEDGEEVGKLALDEQAARVVIEVGLPCLELLIVEEDLVAIARLKERGRKLQAETLSRLRASSLEATDGQADVALRRHVATDAQEDVQVVGHDTELPYIDLGVHKRDLLYLLANHGLAKG